MDDTLKILIVEDDELDRTMSRRALKASGLSVDFAEAATGLEGIRRLTTEPFDCALIDYRIPDVDGLEILREVRKAGVATPIIMLTGQGDDQIAAEVMKAGANDYLSKLRLSRDLLTHAVRHAIRLHKAQSQANRAAALSLESESRFRNMADSAPVLLWVTDAQNRCTYINQPWLSFTGMAFENALGQGWIQAVHRDDHPTLAAIIDDAHHAGRKFDVEYRLRRHDGQWRWVFSSGAPRFLGDGSLEGFVVSCNDVTERRLAEQSFRFLADASAKLSSSLDYEQTLASVARLAVPSLADWCVVDMLDSDGRLRRLSVVHADPAKATAAEDLRLHYHARADVSSGVYHVLRTGEAELYPRLPEKMLASNSLDANHLAVLRTLGLGSVMFVPLIARGKPLGVISLATQESGRVYGPPDLALAEDLARRAATAADNAMLYREAREASAAKDRFLAVLSHELRTPLTPVLCGVQEMEKDRSLSPEMRQSVEMIRRNVELEARLIDDLLDLTRIAKGKLQLDIQTANVHDCLSNVLSICRSDIEGRRLKLTTDLRAETCFVRADASRLQQVFWNLLNNAVKFTAEEGCISIVTRNSSGPAATGPSDDSNATISIEIRDDGIGIEPDLLPRIFDAFEQGERSITRRFGGLGLGLAICKALVTMQGGGLTAASEGKGRGACFTTVLRCTAPPAAPVKEGDNGRDAAAMPRLRILLVDDHQDTARAMRRLLQRLGHHIVLADSVARAKAAFDHEPFDLLISDIGLPDGSGLDLMKMVRGRMHIRGIALSGFGMDDDVRKSKAAGFLEHLTKPINFEKLEDVIKKVIEQDLP